MAENITAKLTTKKQEQMPLLLYLCFN